MVVKEYKLLQTASEMPAQVRIRARPRQNRLETINKNRVSVRNRVELGTELGLQI